MYLYLLTFLMALIPGISFAACSRVAVVPLYWDPNISPFDTSRLEVRQCDGPSGSITIELWKERAKGPALVMDTSDFVLHQVVIKENVLLLETSGGSRDQVFVFQYQRGNPTLKLRQVTKGRADVQIIANHVTVTITGIYAGDLPPRTKTVEFETALGELRP